MSPARWPGGAVLAADASLHAATSTVRLAVVGGGALLLVAGLATVLVLQLRRRRRVPEHPVYRGASAVDPAPRTVVAWQPDPPAGMPPGTVPKQPQTGPRRR